VTLHWADIVLMVAIVVAGCGASYLLALARLRRILAENHREIDRRVAALTEAIAMRVPGSSETVPATDALAATEIEVEAGFAEFAEAQAQVHEAALHPLTADQEDGEIPPEIKAAIAAAAIAAFGNHARVRSARRVPSSDVVSPWTQQGRVIVQSSHNLRTKGRG
jgi:hypothetical protein